MGLNSLHNFTAGDVTFTAHIMTGFTLPGVVISVLVLLAFAYTAWKPQSRSHLDRVSFRLMTYAIIANIFFGIAFIMDVTLTGPSAGCSFVAFLTNISLLFSACLLFCIALNLQLVLVHGVNGNAMEKWYLIGSTIVACALNVPVYALNEFGWNVANSTCWFSNPNDTIRLRYVIGTQSFWVLLIACGEVVTFFVVLFYMLRYDRNARSLLSTPSSTMLSKAGTSTYLSSKSSMAYGSRYRGIILRIGLYPLVSCILNFSTVALDLYQTVDGVSTNIQFYMSIVDLCLYGLRLTCYAALAATDPSFLKAVRALRKPSVSTFTSERNTSRYNTTGTATTQTMTQGQLTVHIELQQVSKVDSVRGVDGKESTVSIQDKDDKSAFEFSEKKDEYAGSDGDVERNASTGTDGVITARAQALQAELDEDMEGARQFMRYI